MSQLTGCDELREWLIAQGFRVSRDGFGRDNECNWYAYRRSELQARECECNDGKRMQIVVRPHKFTHPKVPGGSWESAAVDVTGEAGGAWFKLEAYSLKHDELRERLGDIERSLIAAWNALVPDEATHGAERREEN
jgi:hypothetical protein